MSISGAALDGISDPAHRRAAIEGLVRVRLLAQDAEAAGLHHTPEFLARYTEELARLQIQKSFEEPFTHSSMQSTARHMSGHCTFSRS